MIQVSPEQEKRKKMDPFSVQSAKFIIVIFCIFVALYLYAFELENKTIIKKEEIIWQSTIPVST